MGTKPFQLLEINIISAQDLEPIAKKMCTYAKAWVHPTRKLSSCMDTEGNNNPTWNDKFVFRVDEGFLRGDTSAVMIEIYTPHWFRDVVVGTVRVLVGNLIPPPSLTGRHHMMGMRFIALQVRRPSGRPQGILNIGVTVLDGSLRSMPLYNDCMSAVGYRDLMQDPHPQRKENQSDDREDIIPIPIPKPILRRSRSERSTCIALDDYSPKSSMVGGPILPPPKLPFDDGSIISISDFIDPFMGKKKGKASSVINGEELREKPKHKCKKSKASSVISGSELTRERSKRRGKKGKAGSVLSFKKHSPSRHHKASTSGEKNDIGDDKMSPDNGLVQVPNIKVGKFKERIPAPIITKHNVHDYGAPPKAFKGSSVLSGSEIGPSPSEVAMAIMAERRYPLQQDNQSSVLDGWSLNESVEGLKSRLERWRTELPPLYDHHGGYGGGSSAGSYRSSVTRRRSESGNGVFSCFGTICGLECQCTFGKPTRKKNHGGRYSNSSNGSTGRSFL